METLLAVSGCFHAVAVTSAVCVAAQVCGYPAYFARPLFERIILYAKRSGRYYAGMDHAGMF